MEERGVEESAVEERGVEEKGHDRTEIDDKTILATKRLIMTFTLC